MINDHVNPKQPSQTPKRFITPTMSMLFCFSLAAFGTGCGTTATILKTGGDPSVDATITRSTSDKVYVDTTSGEVGIPRQNIADIDHPGNVAATFGGVISAYGILNIIEGLPNCDWKGAAYCTGVFLPTAIGASLVAYGMTVWARSVNSAIATSAPATASRVTVVPVASMDKKNDFYGVTARVSF